MSAIGISSLAGDPSRATRGPIQACGAVGAVLLVTALAFSPASVGAAEPADAAEVAGLMSQNLMGAPGKEVLMITVSYPPGGSSAPHRHDAQVFVYVLEGRLTMQVRGAPAVTLGPGQTFYEAPADVHQVSANASQTQPAKILVFIVKDKAKSVSRPVTP